MRQVLTKFKSQVLTLVLTIAALAVGQSAWAASTFTIDASYNSNTHKTTFTITRTGNTAVQETIDWRVVSFSAMAGQHFTVDGQSGYDGTATFSAGISTASVTIRESTPDNDAYKYQNGSTRKYRFEVLDRDGYILASKDRSMTTGTSVPSSGAFNEKEITIFTTGTQFTDAGYNQSNNPHYIESSAYYNLTGIAPKAYYTLIGAQLRSTLSLEAGEENNGYQYVQILINNITDSDNRSTPKCNDGDPGHINISRYMAGFDHDPGNKNTTYAAYTFPVTSQPDNNTNEVVNAWNNGVTNKLYKQKFNTNCRATDGRLILPVDFEKFVVRFNASGGGSDHDEWLAKNVKAHIQAVDGTAPTVLNNYKVSGGRHQKGNTIYVSVAFSEIVTVTGTPTLSSNWGTLSYVAGSGSNVLTFMGTIDPSDNNAFGVSGYTLNGGTIKDLAGNSFSGSISHSFGTTLDEDYAWTTSDFNQLETNTYEIYTTLDMRHLALMVNSGNNNCSGLTFKQTHDITYTHTTNWNNSSSQEDNYTAIGTDDHGFQGTFDGQDHTISGIRIYRGDYTSADDYQGLFGYISGGTVRGVNLADARITGFKYVGGIAGKIYSCTVKDCTVAADVCIHAVHGDSDYHGGIVGNSQGTVQRCLSRARLTVTDASDCGYYGAIVGYNNNHAVKDCIAIGASVPSVSNAGAIIGYGIISSGVYDVQRNYYRDCTVAGVENATGVGVGYDKNTKSPHDVTANQGAQALYSLTLSSGVTQVRTASATLPGTGNKTYTTGADIDGTPYAFDGAALTFSYTGEAVTTMGYAVLFYKDGTPFEGNSYKMTTSDVSITASATDLWGIADNADGSADHPYRIGTRTALDLLASYVNSGISEFDSKHFLQTENLTYDEIKTYINNVPTVTSNYTAIGYYNDDNDHKAFKGHYNGGGRTITGIQIIKTGHANSDGYLGLFGYIDGGTIENVVLTQSLIKGNRNIGSIAGYLQNGTIQNCHIGSNVSIVIGNASNAAYQGGVVGQMSSGSCVQGCFCGANINRSDQISTANWYYGGIAGYSLGTIQNNIYTGSFYNYKLDSFGGAIAGDHSGGTLANNYYTSKDVPGGINYTDQDGARRARTVTLGENVALSGDQTEYDVSGLTAIGTTALSYNDGTTTTIYSGEGQNLTLSYTGDMPTGYALVYSTTVGTVNGNILVMPDEDVTVSANVSLITYTVRFNKNNDDASGTMSNQSFTYDEAQNLTANAFTRTGYDFAGWSTTADGSGTTYTDGQEVSNLTSDNGAVIDLFAQWTPITVTYIDENGDEQSITYPGFTLLESSTDISVQLGTLGAETWYVAKDNVSITFTGGTPLKLYGAFHLILMDGATLTVEGQKPISTFGSLTIYGQSLGTGRLEATGSGTAIYVNTSDTEVANNGTLTINGGTVNATSTGSNGISAKNAITINGGNVTALGSGMTSIGISLTQGDITINGGTVNATGGERGNGIYGNSTITINGGNVSATGGTGGYGIRASTITLGWRNASDRIYASSYFSDSDEVVIKSGQTLTDGTDLYSGTVVRTRLAGKTLQPTVSYVDADGNTQNTTAIPLTNTMTTLAAGTYVVNSNLSFDHGLIFTDNVDLILVDGYTMSIGTEDNRINGSNALDCEGGLTIYGQTAGTGTLNLWADNKAALEASHIIICGGTINANSVSGYGIRGNNGINIFSGNVNATSTSNYCIWSNFKISILGGVVNAINNAINNQSKGISNDYNDIILGWTKLTDRITASSYFAKNGHIYITKALYCPESVNGSNIFYCPLEENYRKAVKGKTLSPAVILDVFDPAIADVASTCAAANAISEGTGKVAVQLYGRTLYKDGAWNTLCLPFDLTLSGSVLDGDNVDVRTLSSSEFNNGTLTMNFTAQGAVTELVAGTPYIIKWSKDNESAPDLTNLVNPEFSNVTVKNITANVTTTDVDFIGTYNQIVWDTENQSILFLSGNNTLYFPQPSSDSNNNFTNYPSINAFSAYFQLKNGLTASEVHQTRINFEDNEVNGIILMNNEQLTMNNDWYTLDGVKLDKQPMKKGMYINNGRKVVIK